MTVFLLIWSVVYLFLPTYLLERLEPERILYLAIHEEIYLTFFSEDIVKFILEDRLMKVIVFDPIQEVITQWIE